MNTHQTTALRTRRRVAVALLLPLLLVLGGCFRLDMGIDINEDDTADISMEVGDITGMMSREEMDCSSLESELTPGAGSEDIDFEIEETETDGNVGCRILASGAPLDSLDDESMSIEREGDNFVFTFSGDDTDAPDMSQMPAGAEPQVSIAVTFPGEVVSADDNGEIDGDTVTWNGLEAFSTGGTATGAAASGGIGGIGGGDSSTIIWIVLGVVVLIALAALIFLLVKRKQQRSAAPAAAGYGDTSAAYGQPAGPGYGQPGQPGYSTQGYGAPSDGSGPPAGGPVPPTTPTTPTTPDGPQTPPPSQQPPSGNPHND